MEKLVNQNEKVEKLAQYDLSFEQAIYVAWPYLDENFKENLEFEHCLSLFKMQSLKRKNSFKDEVFYLCKEKAYFFKDYLALTELLQQERGWYYKQFWTLLITHVECNPLRDVDECEKLYFYSLRNQFWGVSTRKRNDAWLLWFIEANTKDHRNFEHFPFSSRRYMWEKRHSFTESQKNKLWKSMFDDCQTWDNFMWLFKDADTEDEAKKRLVYKKMKKIAKSFEQKKFIYENTSNPSKALVRETLKHGLKYYKNWKDIKWMFLISKNKLHPYSNLFKQIKRLTIKKATNWEKAYFVYKHHPHVFHLVYQKTRTFEQALKLWKKTAWNSDVELQTKELLIKTANKLDHLENLILIVKPPKDKASNMLKSNDMDSRLFRKIDKLIKSKSDLEHFLSVLYNRYYNCYLSADIDEDGVLDIINKKLFTFSDWRWFLELHLINYPWTDIARKKLYDLAKTYEDYSFLNYISTSRDVLDVYYWNPVISKLKTFKECQKMLEDSRLKYNERQRFKIFRKAQEYTDKTFEQIYLLCKWACDLKSSDFLKEDEENVIQRLFFQSANAFSFREVQVIFSECKKILLKEKVYKLLKSKAESFHHYVWIYKNCIQNKESLNLLRKNL